MKKLGMFLVAVALVAGCSKKADPADSKMAKLCVEATKQLASPSDKPETFQMQLSNALEACSGGCDDGNQDACKTLDTHIHKLCGVSESMCKQLCDSVKSPSLKKATCEFKK